jgi:hypothetical protein
MVVQSIALPKVSGSSREHELAPVPAEGLEPSAAGGGYHGIVLVPLLAAAQIAWLGLLAYGAFRVLG